MFDLPVPLQILIAEPLGDVGLLGAIDGVKDVAERDFLTACELLEAIEQRNGDSPSR